MSPQTVAPLLVSFALGACAAAAVQTHASAPASEPTARPIVGATVVQVAQAERRRSPPGSATISVLARGKNAFVGRLELEPAAKVPEHRDETEEFIVVLEGGGAMDIEGQHYDVGVGDAIYMPAQARVSFTNGAAKTIAIQVFAGPEPAAKYDAWTPITAP